VTLEYSQHIGPTCVHGGVTLSFEAAQRFSFRSAAQWPSSDQLDSFVERGVRSALNAHGLVEKYACTLNSVVWHEIHSSGLGFERAAYAATIGLLEAKAS
jgi:hypothetical protein